MRKLTLILLVIIILTSVGYTQTCVIGMQVWSIKNLDVTTFSNGDSIPQAKTNAEWKKAGENKQPIWCYYDNDTANGVKYGKIYNWYAVSDSRGLAPKGWHVPSHSEWTILMDFLGGNRVAGKKMKSKQGWFENGNGDNVSGFTCLPGGTRHRFGEFGGIGKVCSYWSSSEYDIDEALYQLLGYSTPYVICSDNACKNYGCYVRCIKD